MQHLINVSSTTCFSLVSLCEQFIQLYIVDYHVVERALKSRIYRITALTDCPIRCRAFSPRSLEFVELTLNYKSREVGEAMRILQKTMLLELVYPSVETNLPIVPDMKKRPRLMWLDTGLVNYAAGVQSELYSVDDLNDAWRGKIAEHIIGQELLGQNNLFLEKRTFWIRDSRNSQAELDYLYNSRRYGLVPIEVKAGSNAHLKSLQEFMFDSRCKYAIRFWNKPERKDVVHIEKKDRDGTIIKSRDYTLYSLPYYYAGQLEKVMERIDSM